MPSQNGIAVYLEVGTKRVFACAVDWPGWCRVAKSNDEAIETLAAYAPRYARVAAEAGIAFPSGVAADAIDVVERVPGSATTDFGAPGVASELDQERYGSKQAERMVALVEASWRILDRVVASAPAELRKGPRGGGRDRDKMFAHVLDAEFAAYARKIGLKIQTPDIDDRTGIDAGHKAMIEVLQRPFDGKPPEGKNWLPGYAARRIAWHALDHAWEIEDRSPAS
jgi:hypothetical protein